MVKLYEKKHSRRNEVKSFSLFDQCQEHLEFHQTRPEILKTKILLFNRGTNVLGTVILSISLLSQYLLSGPRLKMGSSERQRLLLFCDGLDSGILPGPRQEPVNRVK